MALKVSDLGHETFDSKKPRIERRTELSHGHKAAEGFQDHFNHESTCTEALSYFREKPVPQQFWKARRQERMSDDRVDTHQGANSTDKSDHSDHSDDSFAGGRIPIPILLFFQRVYVRF
jgi:hypothetical protein